MESLLAKKPPLPQLVKDRPTEFKTRKGQRVYRRRIYCKNSSIPTHSNNYTFRVQRDNGDAYFNLGTDKRQAGTTADEITAFLSIEGNTVNEALERYSTTHRGKAIKRAKQAASTTSAITAKETTVDAICERYLEITSHLSPKTVANNTNAIRHIAAGILKLPKLGRNQTKAQQQEWRKKTGKFLISSLTNERVEQFRQRELKAVKDDFQQLGATTTTLNSYIRSARSIFSKKLLAHYQDLSLPDFIPFHDIPQLPEPSHRYRSKIDVAQLILSASQELKQDDPVCWIIFLLAIGVGLRSNEIDKLMIEQIDLKNRRIWIRTTPYFRPKSKNSEDYIDVSESVMEEISNYLDSIDDENPIFLIPGKLVGGAKMRSRPTFRRLLSWLRSKGINEHKPIHTLRKEAGSMLFKRDGSLHKVAEFLRNDPRVAKEHYVGRKERIEIELPGLS